MASEIADLLDQLANYQAQRDYLSLQKQELIDQILPPEIKARLEEIEAEFTGKVEAVDENIASLEAAIKEEVLRNGASVRGTFLRAVWSRGRVSWDAKAMDEYAGAHPELLAFRKQGEPFVRITRIDG
jgi:hypothetical protein